MPVPLPASDRDGAGPDDWQRFAPPEPEYDLVVIGAGSAGYAAAHTAAAAGVRVAIIEGGEKVGGLCILRGCMPSKSLLESAHRWHDIRRAGEFGLVAKPVKVKMASIQARKRHLVGGFADYRRRQLKRGKFDFLRGSASFLDPHTLLLARGKTRQLVTGKTFIIATGSEITRVPVPGLWETGCWTSDTALDLDRLPRRLAVLGGGVIAIELGQFFARLGVRTTLLQRGRHIARAYDPDVGAELRRAFAADGIDVLTGVTLLQVRPSSKGKKITYLQGKKKRELVVDEILYALGRWPAIPALRLQNAGVKIQHDRFEVDCAMATNVPHIYAAGDVIAHHEVVHIAIQQAEVAARNAIRRLHGQPNAEEIDYRLKSIVTFTDPEIALVGLTESEARQKGISCFTAKYPFRDHGKAIIGGHLFGFVKILAEKTRGEIIGAQIIGPHASDLIHELIAVMYFRGTVRDLAKMPHYHPTLAEIVTYPAEEIIDRLHTESLVHGSVTPFSH